MSLQKENRADETDCRAVLTLFDFGNMIEN